MILKSGTIFYFYKKTLLCHCRTGCHRGVRSWTRGVRTEVINSAPLSSAGFDAPLEALLLKSSHGVYLYK